MLTDRCGCNLQGRRQAPRAGNAAGQALHGAGGMAGSQDCSQLRQPIKALPGPRRSCTPRGLQVAGGRWVFKQAQMATTPQREAAELRPAAALQAGLQPAETWCLGGMPAKLKRQAAHSSCRPSSPGSSSEESSPTAGASADNRRVPRKEGHCFPPGKAARWYIAACALGSTANVLRGRRA